jgi:hypothetical protein
MLLHYTGLNSLSPEYIANAAFDPSSEKENAYISAGHEANKSNGSPV